MKLPSNAMSGDATTCVIKRAAFVGYGTSKMLECLVCGRGGDEEAFLVTSSQSIDDSGSGNGGVADVNDILAFGFEDAVKVSAHTNRVRGKHPEFLDSSSSSPFSFIFALLLLC